MFSRRSQSCKAASIGALHANSSWKPSLVSGNNRLLRPSLLHGLGAGPSRLQGMSLSGITSGFTGSLDGVLSSSSLFELADAGEGEQPRTAPTKREENTRTFSILCERRERENTSHHFISDDDRFAVLN